VKQAEVFAAIRAEYNIPRDDALQLRDFPTLAHTIQFVYDRRPDVTAPVPDVAAVEQTVGKHTGMSKAGMPQITGDMSEAEKIPRRMPVPQLRPALELCKSTGVVLNQDSRVIVMPDQGGVAKALISRLKKLGVDVLAVAGAPTSEQLTGQLEKWLGGGPVQGVYWLPALDAEGPPANMDLPAWREATRVRVKLLYTTLRTLYPHFGQPGTFLVSATRLGGRHGYDAAGALAPLGGAVCGLTKTFKREKPDALVKVVDFERQRRTAAYAEILIAETRQDPGAVEIGYQGGQRCTIGLEDRPVAAPTSGLHLDKNTVFVITGAAGSIVSAITADLAAASGGTFHLLDLTPEPDAADADLRRFVNAKDDLKRDIFARLKEGGQRATPAMVEKELAGLERKHAALSAIEAVQQAGGRAFYHSVNLLDGEAMAKVMQAIKETSGRIDVMLHAGGLEISHLLPDKSPKEFDLVFDVKADGWFNLISNIGDMSLGAVVVFSSIAGRFGNAGQADYSAANDLLCKAISNFKTTRPETRAIAIDWTAWGGIGMAARGSIPTIMKQAGIDMLPPEAGIPVVRRELVSGDPHEEVVIAQRLGMMLQEFDAAGGLDTQSDALSRPEKHRGVISQKVVGMGLYSGLTVVTSLDPQEQPFLFDHQIAQTPVLPGVMGIEAMVEAACLLFPERHVTSVEDVHFYAPFKFYRNAGRDVTVRAHFSPDGDDIIALCHLEGARLLHGREEAEITTHFTARVRLSRQPLVAERARVPARGKKKAVAAGDIYKLYFHGPAYQVLTSSWRSGSSIVGLFAGDLPDNHRPATRRTMAAPRLIELCFQTAGIWEMGKNARMGLPNAITEVKILQVVDDRSGEFTAIVTPAENDTFDAKVVNAKGEVCVSLCGYRTMALPDTIDKALLAPLQVVLS
jgi:NAD(P)-dependent dehydrogenase (short-subunit alcohol dehydrogenase family)